MTLYLDQKWLTSLGKVYIYNEYKKNLYQVEVSQIALRHQISILDADTQQVLAQVKDPLTPFLNRKLIYYANKRIASVRQHTVKRRPVYEISGLNWRISGDFGQRQYTITDRKETVIADVKKSWVFGMDTFAITIHVQDVDPVIIVAAVLALNLSIAFNHHYEVVWDTQYGLE